MSWPVHIIVPPPEGSSLVKPNLHVSKATDPNLSRFATCTKRKEGKVRKSHPPAPSRDTVSIRGKLEMNQQNWIETIFYLAENCGTLPGFVLIVRQLQCQVHDTGARGTIKGTYRMDLMHRSEARREKRSEGCARSDSAESISKSHNSRLDNYKTCGAQA